MADKQDMTQYLTKEQHKQAKEAADDMLKATDRILKMTGDTKAVGVSTLQDLEGQTEQLRRTDGNMDRVHADVSKSKKLMRKLNIFGDARETITSHFHDSSKTEDDFQRSEKLEKIKMDSQREKDKLARERALEEEEHEERKKQRWFNIFDDDGGSHGKGSKSEPKPEKKEPEKHYEFFHENVSDKLKKKDDNLDLISNDIKTLHLLAMEAGDEIERQGAIIDSVENKIDEEDPRLKALSKEMGGFHEKDSIGHDIKGMVKNTKRAAKFGKMGAKMM